MKHHFVPQFALKNWAEADGKVPYFRWLDGRTICGRTAPRSAAFEHDLYARDKVPEKERHIIETFFAKFDSEAAPLYQRFLQLEKFIPTAEQRTAWAMFLVAANLRTPDIVKLTKADAEKTLRGELDKDPDAFEKAYGSPPPITLLEWTEQRVPGLIENFGLEILVRQLVRPEVVQPFMDLEWSAHSFPEANVELIIGDRPLWYYERPDHAHFSIALPLSPRVLFVGSRQPLFSREIVDAGHNVIARKVNRSMVSRAVEYVYGRAELKFVDRTFKETPDRLRATKPINADQSTQES